METIQQSQTYHAVLAKLYMVYFLAAIVGIFVDLIFPLHFSFPRGNMVAIFCFVASGILIIWAQYVSRYAKKDADRQYFTAGPYRFMRNPTQLGLILLVAGYALIMQSYWFLIAILCAYLISNRYFKTYELLVENKYGEHYVEYKKTVKKIL